MHAYSWNHVNPLPVSVSHPPPPPSPASALSWRISLSLSLIAAVACNDGLGKASSWACSLWVGAAGAHTERWRRADEWTKHTLTADQSARGPFCE